MDSQDQTQRFEVSSLHGCEDEALIRETLGVLDVGLDPNAYRFDGLQAAVRDADQLVLVARGERVAGVLVANVLGADRSWYDNFGAAAAERVHAARRPVNLAGLAVLPAWRKRGVGKALIHAGLDWARTRDSELALASSWLHPGPDTSLRLFVECGFTAVARASGIYLARSLKDGLICRFCGGPCRCAGELCVLPLQS